MARWILDEAHVAGTKNRGPRPGSRRVEGWVYEVINPLLDAMHIEMAFLERGNVTWRFLSRSLEHIRSLDAYLPRQGLHILRDFQRANRGVQKRLSRHDELVEALAQAALHAHDWLVGSADFRQRVEHNLAEFMRADPEAAHPGGALSPEQFPDLVAEHVVNQTAQLPPHHTDSRFWDRFGVSFLEFKSGPPFRSLDAARTSLLEYDRTLVDWLEKKSFDLCERYDIPAAPIPSLSSQAP